MNYKTRCEAEAKKYLKKMQKHFYEAFQIGFHDGKAGMLSERPKDNGPAYLEFAWSMYMSGFKAGKKVKQDESV